MCVCVCHSVCVCVCVCTLYVCVYVFATSAYQRAFIIMYSFPVLPKQKEKLNMNPLKASPIPLTIRNICVDGAPGRPDDVCSAGIPRNHSHADSQFLNITGGATNASPDVSGTDPKRSFKTFHPPPGGKQASGSGGRCNSPESTGSGSNSSYSSRGSESGRIHYDSDNSICTVKEADVADLVRTAANITQGGIIEMAV